MIKVVTQTPDLVYILGNGSRWNNNELRFSLRSVFKNLTGFRNIYVIGENPGFLKENPKHKIIFISHPDELGPQNADGNIIRKVIRACNEPDLSNEFLKMNDDYIIAKPTHAPDIYPMFKYDLAPKPDSYFANNAWRQRLKKTREHLTNAGLPTLHFDYHAPIIFDKNDFPAIVNQFDYASDIGLVMRSLYGNVKLTNAKQLTNEKRVIFTHQTLPQITQSFGTTRHFIAFNDDGLNDELKYFLAMEYPNPSPWETGDVDCKIYQIHKWWLNGMNFDMGMEIMKKYVNKAATIKTLSYLERERAHVKMKYQLLTRLPVDLL